MPLLLPESLASSDMHCRNDGYQITPPIFLKQILEDKFGAATAVYLAKRTSGNAIVVTWRNKQHVNLTIEREQSSTSYGFEYFCLLRLIETDITYKACDIVFNRIHINTSRGNDKSKTTLF